MKFPCYEVSVFDSGATIARLEGSLGENIESHCSWGRQARLDGPMISPWHLHIFIYVQGEEITIVAEKCLFLKMTQHVLISLSFSFQRCFVFTIIDFILFL